MTLEDYNPEDVFQAMYIPKQKPASPPPKDDPRINISSYPPLGQITTLPASSKSIGFIVNLEVDQSIVSKSWEIALWYSTAENTWEELLLGPVKEGTAIQNVIPILSKEVEKTSTLYFKGSLPAVISQSPSFTIKFRTAPDQEWQWVRNHQGQSDGTVIFQPSTDLSAASNDLGDYIKDLNSAFKIESVKSQSPGAIVWDLTSMAKPAGEELSNFDDIVLGKPWGGFMKWFALVRLWAPWLAPRAGKSQFELDKEAVMASFLSPTGKHMVILGVSGLENVMTMIKHDDAGNVVIQIRNDNPTKAISRVIVAISDDFDHTNSAAMYQARSLVQSMKLSTGEHEKEIKAASDGVNAMWLENWFDGLTYCTWNGLGQRLTDEKIYNALDKLSSANVNITNLIIDDNWQSLDYAGHGQFQYGWNEFEADRNTFPNGLKATVSKIRKEHPNIQHVAVWHAIMGYWGGLAPNGHLAKTYDSIRVVREDAERRNLPLGGAMTVVSEKDVGRFYNDFYSFLSDAGIDAVKTDAQFILDTIVKPTDRKELIRAYLDAWTVNSLKYFSVKAISCMSQTPQILFYSQMPTDRPPILVRNSDDFFPEIKESHPWHVFCNAGNAVFTQHLNITPDWDMFQTVHDYSAYHAAARCISGGPVYITDEPGKHNIDLIKQMTGPSVKMQAGKHKTVIFRPENIGKTLDPYVAYNDEVLLKVGNYVGRAETGTSLIAVFNVSAKDITELMPISKFPGLVEGKRYVIRAHNTGYVSKPILVNENDVTMMIVKLPVIGFEIYSAYPLTQFETSKNAVTEVATLGLLGKMTGAAAVVENEFSTNSSTGRIEMQISVKALGVLGIYISTLKHPSFSVSTHLLITILGEVVPASTVSIGSDKLGGSSDTGVLQIDLEKAWEEMKLDGKEGWGNNVVVKVFLTPVA